MDKILYENKDLFDAFIKDDLSYIAYLYMVYSLRIHNPEIKKYNNISTQMKIKNLIKTNAAFRMANQYTFSDAFLDKLFKKTFEYLLNVKKEELISSIDERIIEFFEKNKCYNSDIEKLREKLEGNDKKNLIIMTSIIPKYVYETNDIDEIYFNYYDDKNNFLGLILFELRNINGILINKNSSNFPTERKYDSILFTPPLKQEEVELKILNYKKNDEPRRISFECSIIYRLLKLLTDDGDLLGLIPSGILNKHSDIPFKKRVIDEKMLSLIIELPKIENIPTNVSLVYFENGSEEVKVINATKFAQNLRRGINLDSDKIIRAIDGNIEGAVGVMASDYIVANNYNLTPHRFFENLNTEFVNPTKLSEIITSCFRGFQITSDMLDEYLVENKTKIKLLTLSDIENNMVNTKGLQSLKAIDKRMEHYLLKDKDLVISCKGKTFKTAVVNIPENEYYVSTGSLIVLRCDHQKVDSMYLKIFFDSYLGNEALKRIQTGTKVLSLNPTQLLNILVPLPSLSRQMTISSSYKYKLSNIEEVKEVAENMKIEMENKFDKNFLKLLNM